MYSFNSLQPIHHHFFYLLLLLFSFDLWIGVDARRCYYYTDRFGRTRQRCSGLAHGGIIGIVIGGAFILLMIMLLLRLIRRNHQKRALPIHPQAQFAPPPPPPPPPNDYYQHFPPPTQTPHAYGHDAHLNPSHFQPPPGPPPPLSYPEAEKFTSPSSPIQIPTPAVTH